MAHATSRLGSLLLITLLLAGCATTAAMRAGQRAELSQDYDRAVVEYTRALQADPDNRDARQGLERARLFSWEETARRTATTPPTITRRVAVLPLVVFPGRGVFRPPRSTASGGLSFHLDQLSGAGHFGKAALRVHGEYSTLVLAVSHVPSPMPSNRPALRPLTTLPEQPA